jgi:hypothetical protein
MLLVSAKWSIGYLAAVALCQCEKQKTIEPALNFEFVKSQKKCRWQQCNCVLILHICVLVWLIRRCGPRPQVRQWARRDSYHHDNVRKTKNNRHI